MKELQRTGTGARDGNDATVSRKAEHVRLCMEEEVSFTRKATGFECWEFEHNALPELNFDEVDTSCEFLGYRLTVPLIVSGMTGGYKDAESLNRSLARLCRRVGIVCGVGSQRQMLDDDRFLGSYTVVREEAPDVPVIANIGAAEIARLKDFGPVRRLVDVIGADALAVHCNPLQEFLQPEGNPEFRGALEAIGRLVHALSVPVIVKEVGAGISARVARRLEEAGVRWIDVAGAGGTSWAGVEMMRREETCLPVSREFWDWGIPTADALREVRQVVAPGVRIVASGGIADGVMMAKALALGADFVGVARPVLLALWNDGFEEALRLVEGWANDLKGVMFLTGSRTISDLKLQSLRCIAGAR